MAQRAARTLVVVKVDVKYKRLGQLGRLRELVALHDVAERGQAPNPEADLRGAQARKWRPALSTRAHRDAEQLSGDAAVNAPV